MHKSCLMSNADGGTESSYKAQIILIGRTGCSNGEKKVEEMKNGAAGFGL